VPAPPLAVVPTKLEPPYRRPGIVDRSRLLDRLDGLDSRIVGIVAPAGYGKSTAAWQFAERVGGPVAWLSADQRDDDPATLVRGLAAALHRVTPLSTATIASVDNPGASVWNHAVPAVGAVLRDHPDVRLVIDDVHRIEGQDSIDVLMALAAHVQEPRQLVLVGRTLGSLPAPRLQSSGLLTVVERDALALETTEIAAVLAAAGASLDPDEVAARTEGWAAGVYLMALASIGAARRGMPIASPVTGRLVEDYLRIEVLDELPPDDADLILRSSVLERLSGPLCDHLLERAGSGADLDRIERMNLFLIPLDRERSWFRYHALLGDFLRAELERRDPEGARRMRRRAAEWHERHGLLEPALEYAISADDEELAAALTIRTVQGTLNAGRVDTARRWFDWFEAGGAGERQVGLAALGALVFALEGDVARAERWADHADRAPGGRDPEDPASGVRAVERSVLMRSGMAGLADDTDLAMRIIPDGDPWRIAAVLMLGARYRMEGDEVAAEPLFREVVSRRARGEQADITQSAALFELTAFALARGDREAAERHMREARALLSERGLTEHGVALGVDALDARMLASHGATDRARAVLAHAQRLRPKLTFQQPWLALRSRLELVRAHLALGDAGGARTILAEVRDILEVRPDVGVLVDEAREIQGRVDAMGHGVAGSSTLTMAELRLLPLLTTHLSFREIGERLYISPNTVKTQALSIYRKLDATSRSEAVERATRIGLLGSSAGALEAL
jgi:LuxR family maltose regulon positive regulatory protein